MRNLFLLSLPALVVGLYVLSICWRVGWNEQQLYGRNYLVPLSLKVPQYTDPGDAQTFFNSTYTFERAGKKIRVHKQLINSFQHSFGSALAAYEIGDLPADLLFRANEYVETIFGCKARPEYDLLDTKKDLANNAIGRSIGCDVRKRGLYGGEAEKAIIEEILLQTDNGSILKHYKDARVVALPSFDDYGCPGLLHLQEVKATIFNGPRQVSMGR